MGSLVCLDKYTWFWALLFSIELDKIFHKKRNLNDSSKNDSQSVAMPSIVVTYTGRQVTCNVACDI